MDLEHWAAPPARRTGVAARGRDRAGGRAAAEPSATRAAAPAPVFVYKPGSACKRNKALLPGAAAAASPGGGAVGGQGLET